MKRTKTKPKPTKTVLVLGGRGFIGRSIVNNLKAHGTNIIVGSRSGKGPDVRIIKLHKISNVKECELLLTGVDVVINAVGILRQRFGETYDQVHHRAVAHLVHACTNLGIRFVHVSALGLYNPVKSRFLKSKRDGERVIQNSQADWYLCRPSLVDGQGGYGAKWFRKVARWPVHFVPANANGNIAPIKVEDLGAAIAKIALMTHNVRHRYERIFELGGDQIISLKEYLRQLGNSHKQKTINVPVPLARLVSHCFDLLHATPYSFGHYELLKFDNVPVARQTNALLGRPCQVFSNS